MACSVVEHNSKSCVFYCTKILLNTVARVYDLKDVSLTAKAPVISCLQMYCVRMWKVVMVKLQVHVLVSCIFLDVDSTQNVVVLFAYD